MSFTKLKSFVAFLAVLLTGAASAYGQIACTTLSASAVLARAEGQTELLPDQTVSCTGTSTGSINLTIFYSPQVALTSKVLNSSAAVTEATAVTSAGSAQGIVQGSSITFTSIPAPSGAFTVSVTNVRLNLTSIPIVAGGAPTTVSAQGFTSGTNVTPGPTNSAAVAYALPAMPGPSTQAVSYSACSNLVPTSGPALLVNFSENFQTAFKTRGGSTNNALGVPFSANTETGYYENLGGVNNTANSATRIRILFTNVPAGISIFVPVSITGANSTSNLPAAALTSTEAGAFAQVAATAPTSGNGLPSSPALAQVAVATGSGEAVYEITAQNPTATDFFSVPVYLNGAASLVTPPAAPITAVVSLGPVTAATVIPSFSAADTLTYAYSGSSTCIPLSISPGSLPVAVQAKAFAQGFTANGASGTVTWSIASGALPAGLALNSSTGVLSGNPTVNGSFSFTVQAMDLANKQATQAYTLVVNAPLTVTAATLPAATVTTAYSQQAITIAGGTGQYTIGVIGGTLPPGLTLSSTGLLSGTPSTPGSYTFTVPVTDSGGGQASANVSLQVNSLPAYCSNPVPTTQSFIRAEGTTELVPDLSFTCNGTGGIVTLQIAISPALTITSKVLNAGTSATEALLITTLGSTPGVINGAGTIITFANVAVPAGTANVRVANIRVNATSVTVPIGQPPVSINETLTLTGLPSALTPVNVAFALNGLAKPTISAVNNYTNCAPISAQASPAFSIQFGEYAANPFKTRGDSSNNVPGSGITNNTETGYYVTTGAANNQATSGTRIKLVLAYVPAGLSVYVPLTLTAPDGAVLTLTNSEAGPFSAVPAVTPTGANTLPATPALGQVSITAGSGTAVYEVTTQNSGTDVYTVPVYLAGTASVGSGAPPITATISFAPVGAPSNIPNFTAVTSSIFRVSAVVSCLNITTASIPGYYRNVANPVPLTASGGTPPYMWSITSGTLPAGLSLSSTTGLISGTPTAAGSTSVTFKVTDSGTPAQSATQTYNITVTNALLFLSAGNGAVGAPYSSVLIAGGTPPYNCSITGALPAGLTLNSATCVLSGTPTSAGAFNVVLSASDSSTPALTTSQQFTLQIANALQITTASLPSLSIAGSTYSATLSAAGGYPLYHNWTVVSGALPNGFTLNPSTGVISGNPRAVTGGPFTFSITVQDGAGNTSPARTYSTAALTSTTTTLTLSSASAALGQPLTLTATLAPTAATGKVTFFDGAVPLGTSTLSAGAAALTTRLLASGPHSLRAVYIGSASYSPSVSAALPEIVSSGAQAGFQSAVNTTTGIAPSFVLSGDFNNDGKTDVAISSLTSTTILLGNGDGTFHAAGASNLPALPGATGDFNGDGNTDLVAFTNPVLGTVAVSLGNGDGTFQAPVTYNTIGNQISIAVADFNGDGIPDILTTGLNVAVLLGNGDGTFYAGPTSQFLSPVTSPVVADFNADGFADFVASAPMGPVVFLGTGNASFLPGVSYPASGNRHAVADFNGDGVADIATSAGILPGKGDGTFGAIIALPTGATGDSITAGDFNGDGRLDLLLLQSASKGATAVNVLIGNGDGTFKAPVPYTAGTSPFYPVIGDFNGDGVTDLAITNTNALTVLPGQPAAPLITFSCNPASGPTTVNVAFTMTCTATGGTPPYNYSIGTSTLPAGLVFTSPNGTISGTPTAAGIYAYTVYVTDSGSPVQTSNQSFAGIIQVAGGGTGGGGGGGGGGTGGGGAPASTLTVSPTMLTFTSTGGVPAAQSITLTSTVPGSRFIAGSTTTGGSFLSVSPNAGTTDTQNTIQVNTDPTGLTAGTYTGTVSIITDKGGIASVAVTLIVQAGITVSPASLAFTYQQGDPAPTQQTIAVSGPASGTAFSAAAMSNPGESWLTIASSTNATPGSVGVSVNPTGLIPGSYTATVAITAGTAAPVNVPVSLTVTKAPPPAVLSVSPATESFTVAQGAAPVQGQFTVSNTGGGTLQFSAQVTQGNWLTLSGSGAGTATPATPGSLGFTINPAGLVPNLYTGHISVQNVKSGSPTVLTVLLSVGTSSQSLVLSQTALTFNAVSNGPSPLSQTFSVGVQGNGGLGWTAQAQVIPNPAAPNANWLSINPPSGISTAGQAGATATVSVNPAGLPAGQYSGSVNIASQGAINSPQSVSVFLNVGATSTVSLTPAGLLFSGPAGGGGQQQQVTAFNPSNTAVSYTLTPVSGNGIAWLSVNPATGTLQPGANTLAISADLTNLPPGLQTGTVNAVFGDGSSSAIQAAVIATGTATGNVTHTLSRFDLPFASGACAGGKPSYLVPVFRRPAAQANLQAATPQTLQMLVADDCGHAVTAAAGGSVQVSFSDGDLPVSLNDVGGGLWEGTWNPMNQAAQVTLQAVASEKGAGSSATGGSITVAVQRVPANGPAQISGVVNAASSAQATPQVVAPGSYVAIYGRGLGSIASPLATTIPLPTNLNSTQLFIGGQPVPLLYAGPGQVNALVPQNLNPNTSYQLVVVEGSTISIPVPLITTAFQPAIYSADLSGSGQGVIEISGTTSLASPATPAVRGKDYLVVFGTGLGPVIGSNGEAAPADGAGASGIILYNTKATVTATVGGVNATVVFSGLTPTLVGLYQVNVQVPAGAPAGSAVPVIISVTDPVTGVVTPSNSVTVALQ